MDRWVSAGATSQPDPCARDDDNPDHYGVTYGPDGNGGCILDTDPSDCIGRFPDLHGTNVDGGYRDTELQRELWNAYMESAEGTTFANVPLNHWAHDAIEALYQGGYLAGCGAKPLPYCPDQAITRAEMAVFVERSLHRADFDPPDPVGVFADVSLENWQAGWVEAAHNAGIILACETEPGLRFCPNAPPDRAMGASMMVQAKGLSVA